MEKGDTQKVEAVAAEPVAQVSAAPKSAPKPKKEKRHSHFSRRLNLILILLITISLSGATLFFLNLYYQDKTIGVFESEFQNTTQSASRLEDLLLLGGIIDLETVRKSKDVLLVVENPCGAATTRPVVISDYVTKSYIPVRTEAAWWSDLSAVQVACLNLLQKPAGSLIFINGGPRLMIPYLLILYRTPSGSRLTMISADGMGGSSGAQILLLLDKAGRVVWSEDAVTTADTELRKLGVTPELLSKIGQEALGEGNPGTRQVSSNAIISFAPITAAESLVYSTIIPRSLITKPVYFVIEQTVFLVLGFLFLCLLLARHLAHRLTGPLAELQDVAEKLGKGDFKARTEAGDEDAEFTIVKKTLNLLAGQIVHFLAETKEKAAIDAEMKLAEKVQQMFLPDSSLKVASLSLLSSTKMAEVCGGDWWGYIEIPKADGTTALLVLIADATGHGTSSALLTGVAQGTLVALNSWVELDPSMGADPRQVLTMFNRSICRSSGGNVNMTMFAAVIDPGAKKLLCCNAGHNHPYLLIPGIAGKPAEMKSLGLASPVLGQSPDNVFDGIEEYSWEKGYQLFLYTDGLTDVARDDQTIFDRKALISALRRNASLSGKPFLDKIMLERSRVQGNSREKDDVTVVLCT